MVHFYARSIRALVGASILFSVLSVSVSAQGVAINGTNASPDASAMLDVQSTTQGMLVPRMSSAQRVAISSPATGLLVFDNSTGSFWFYDGAMWTELISGTDSDNQNLSSIAAGTDRTINITGGTGTTINIADNDDSSTNELQSLGLAANTLSISGGNSVSLAGYLDADNLGNHIATQNLAMGAFEIDNVRFLDVTAGVGNGLRFWQSNSYAINMGNTAEYQYGAVSGYSIKMHMNNDATRGWTWGVDGVTPVASINTQGNMRIAGNMGIGTTTADEMLQVEGHVRAQVLEFGDYDITPPANVDGQLYRTTGQAVIEVDDWLYVRDNDENNRIRMNTDAGRLEFGPGAYAGNAALFGGYVTGNSTSDGHRLLPNGNAPGTTGWGYVGQANTDWYYMYADNFTNTSLRERKKEITALDAGLYEAVMEDIDKIKPSFYRYKGETAEMVPGFETRFRPNLHLGVILDEAPDYLQDQAFSGIDIYAMGVFALTGVKYNRAEIQELKANSGMVSDFGKSTTANHTVWVPFGSAFRQALNTGNEPIVTLTPTSPVSGYYVAEVTNEGFRVNADADFSFTWQVNARQAMQYRPEQGAARTLPGMEVSESQKAAIKAYWDRVKAEQQAEYQKYLEDLKVSDPAMYEKVMEENRRNQSFIESNGN